MSQRTARGILLALGVLFAFGWFKLCEFESNAPANLERAHLDREDAEAQARAAERQANRRRQLATLDRLRSADAGTLRDALAVLGPRANCIRAARSAYWRVWWAELDLEHEDVTVWPASADGIPSVDTCSSSPALLQAPIRLAEQ